MTIQIGILGPQECTPSQYQLGLQTGRLVAEAGAILVCGGLSGMMSAASEGAKSAGGTTLGILPGNDKNTANKYIDIALPTGLGAFRNAILVRTCDAVIAIHGSRGTLSEISFALRLGVPTVGLHTWELRKNGKIDPGICAVESPREAVQTALRLIQKSP